ncbi:MAG TPA: LuxR C-terminal-related transcriptional regulator [Solirubrobacteraceae bacterium]|jgi:PAS domain S-box-containing protein|nr:LuxR C-terminal-related transcriptional regulator [Solirubrobacteraceae bacterium]
MPRSETGWEGPFWLIFERSSNAIVLLDDERRYVDVNPSAVALLGRTRDELLGRSSFESIAPAERSTAAREWQAFLKSGDDSGTRALVRPDGSEVKIDYAARLAMIGERRLAIFVSLADTERVADAPGGRGAGSLTTREREVITLIAMGRETNEIAEQLHISSETVRTHVRNAMSKLGARTRAQLVAIALSTDDTMHLGHLRE